MSFFLIMFIRCKSPLCSILTCIPIPPWTNKQNGAGSHSIKSHLSVINPGISGTFPAIIDPQGPKFSWSACFIIIVWCWHVKPQNIYIFFLLFLHKDRPTISGCMKQAALPRCHHCFNLGMKFKKVNTLFYLDCYCSTHFCQGNVNSLEGNSK